MHVQPFVELIAEEAEHHESRRDLGSRRALKPFRLIGEYHTSCLLVTQLHQSVIACIAG